MWRNLIGASGLVVAVLGVSVTHAQGGGPDGMAGPSSVEILIPTKTCPCKATSACAGLSTLCDPFFSEVVCCKKYRENGVDVWKCETRTFGAGGTNDCEDCADCSA